MIIDVNFPFNCDLDFAYFIYLFYLLHTEHVRQGNANAISSILLAAPPHLETYRSVEN